MKNSMLLRLGQTARLGLVVVALMASVVIAFAADVAKKNFNLPAGVAGETLKQFAVQAGREIVFSPEAIGTVPTKAVQGRFTPSEALDRMLSGTGLVVSQDAKIGAFAVRKGATARQVMKPPAQSAIPPAPPKGRARLADGSKTSSQANT